MERKEVAGDVFVLYERVVQLIWSVSQIDVQCIMLGFLVEGHILYIYIFHRT